MKKTITFCNYCGKEFDETDKACGFHIRYQIGYGSIHDGDWLVLDLCSDCLDNLIDSCKIMPLEEGASSRFDRVCTADYASKTDDDPFQIRMEV